MRRACDVDVAVEGDRTCVRVCSAPSVSGLLAKIAARAPGIVVYGLSPPKTSATAPAVIAARQIERIAALDVDGVIVYDLQDEAERSAEPRPFPFLPTLDPMGWAHERLATLAVPKIVYRCVAGDTAASFVDWLARLRGQPSPLAVLVGAPSGRRGGSLPLDEAYALARAHAPEVQLGGIAIAERHARRLDEHTRILAKTAAGCRFFVTQAVYDVTWTKSLISDYALALAERDEPAAPLVLTFSPCGSATTLAFMQWLGIAFPRWLDNDLRRAADPLARSLAVCEQILGEVWPYARELGVPIGINVESVSIKRAEIDAATELLARLRTVLAT